MANLTLDPEAVESERSILYSERRLRVDNDNQGGLFEQVNAAAFYRSSLPLAGDWMAVGHRILNAEETRRLLQRRLRTRIIASWSR